MLFSRKILTLSILFLSLMLFSPHDLLAIGEEAPIIALANNNIYFVSPSDGEVRLIVERDPEKDAVFAAMYAGAGPELSKISPDNTKFAYTTSLYEVLEPEYKERRFELAISRPRELFLVDIASGEVTQITDHGANFAQAVESDRLINIDHLTWSVDGSRLYYLSSAISTRNRVPQRSIEYYDLASGEIRTLTKIPAQVQVRGLYALFTDLLLLDGAQGNQGSFTFTQYDTDGEVVNSVDMVLTGAMDCTNGIMFDMNPVFNRDIIDYYYGYYLFKEDTGEMLPSMLDVSRNNSISLDEFSYPAIVSHANPDTSLRLVFERACDSKLGSPWALTDPVGESIRRAALTDVYYPSEITLSPDGQSVAMLNGETIRIIDVNSETTTTETLLMENGTEPVISVLQDNGTREINFSAERIMWGAIDFTFAKTIHYG